jgi:hypothetical protein
MRHLMGERGKDFFVGVPAEGVRVHRQREWKAGRGEGLPGLAEEVRRAPLLRFDRWQFLVGLLRREEEQNGCARDEESAADLIAAAAAQEVDGLAADAEQNLDRWTVREGRGGCGWEAAETVGDAGELGGAGRAWRAFFEGYRPGPFLCAGVRNGRCANAR